MYENKSITDKLTDKKKKKGKWNGQALRKVFAAIERVVIE